MYIFQRQFGSVVPVAVVQMLSDQSVWLNSSVAIYLKLLTAINQTFIRQGTVVFTPSHSRMYICLYAKTFNKKACIVLIQ